MPPGLAAGLLLALAADTPPSPPAAMKDRADALARFGAGLLQARRDRLLTAAMSFEAAATADPAAAEPLRELVRVYAQVGREPEAIRLARKVLDRDPHDLDTARTLGRLLFEAGEFKDAAAAYALAADSPSLAARPDAALAVRRDLAAARERAGDLAGAVAALTAAQAGLATRPPSRDAFADRADNAERLGALHVKLKQFDAAADAYRLADALYADPARAADPHGAARTGWNLSAVYAAKGDPAAALTHLDAFLRKKPRAVGPYERLADLLRQAGRAGDVVGRLRGLHAADPDNPPLAAVLGAELARDPATRAAGDALLDPLAGASADPDVLRVVFRSHAATGRAGKLVGLVDRAYQEADKDDRPAGEKAAAAARAQAYAGVLRADPAAAGAVVRAAAADLTAGVKRLHQTWHLVGLLAARGRDLAAAEGLFRRAVAGAPAATEAAAYSALVGVLWRARRPADVAAVCRDGLRTADATAPVFFHFHLCLALAELGDAAGALASADRAVEQAGANNDRLTVRLRKAGVLTALGRADDAVAYCRGLLDEADAPADRQRVRYALASALWAAKKPADSEAELRAILEADPDHAGACNDLGYHLADQGRDLDEAERLVRHAVAVDRAERRKSGDPEPESAAYLDSLGWVLFRRGDLAAAREQLEKSAGMPDGAADAVVWDHLGDVLFRQGEKPRARECWETARRLYAADRRPDAAARGAEAGRKLTRVP